MVPLLLLPFRRLSLLSVSQSFVGRTPAGDRGTPGRKGEHRRRHPGGTELVGELDHGNAERASRSPREAERSINRCIARFLQDFQFRLGNELNAPVLEYPLRRLNRSKKAEIRV